MSYELCKVSFHYFLRSYILGEVDASLDLSSTRNSKFEISDFSSILVIVEIFCLAEIRPFSKLTDGYFLARLDSDPSGKNYRK